jgi:adenylate cyclase
LRAPKIEPASKENMAFPLLDKPSIAVLPFDNMSGDPKQEYFSDGITEEIITALSKTPKLFVIARTSSFKYKGKEVDVRTVGRELGVRYVLEGSVRRSEDQLRITAQLIDTKTGNHLWAERYDKEFKDIFALQDEITFKVIAALQVKLTEGEQALIASWGTDNLEAYLKFLKGTEYSKGFNEESNLLARKIAEEVIALDPGYPQGYRLLSLTHMMDVWLGSTESPQESLSEAVRLCQKVIAIQPSDAVTRGLLGIVYTMMRQHEKGIAELQKAIALNPNVADNHAFFGFVLHLNGRNKEALVEIKSALRLNPFPPNTYFFYLGHAYMYEGMYDESIAAYKKALSIEPNNLFTHLRLAACYSLSGRGDEARAEAAEVLKINPQFSLEYFSKTVPFKYQADTEHLINALRKAGLK